MMLRLTGKSVVQGCAKGPALITQHPVNFTAAFTKAMNLLPFKRASFRDAHHPWFKQNVKGKVLVFPACIGSTHTGLVVLDLVRLQYGPAALIVGRADPLIVSGIVVSEVWYGRAIPVVEYPTDDLLGKLADGDLVEVNGDTGEIVIRPGAQ
jgi:predicted aconitase with swiveling domain